jgi:hypothetical protein
MLQHAPKRAFLCSRNVLQRLRRLPIACQTRSTTSSTRPSLGEARQNAESPSPARLEAASGRLLRSSKLNRIKQDTIHTTARDAPSLEGSSITTRDKKSRAGYTHQDTIYALSTAPGRAGIAVIRVSGPACQTVNTCVPYATTPLTIWVDIPVNLRG